MGITNKLILSLFLATSSLFLMAQDECSNAVHLNFQNYSTCGDMVLQSISLNGATHSNTAPNPPCGGFSGTTEDVWYKFNVPAGINTLAFHAFNSNYVPMFMGTSQPAMAIYRGDCNNLTLLDCFEADGGGFMQNGEVRWEVFSGLIPGETIYMRVWDENGNDQSLFIAASIITELPEDDCNTPVELGTGGCNILSTGGDIAAPDACGWTSTDNSIFYWFTVEPDDSQPYVIAAENGECWSNGSSGNPEIQFAVYQWSGNGCNGIGGSGSTYMGCANGTGLVTFSANLPPGDYVLAFDGYSMLQGNSLCIFGFDAPFIDPPEAIVANINSTNAICGIGGSASVSVVESCTGNPTYNWSNGATTSSISNLQEGEYCVTISDGELCIDTVLCTNVYDEGDISVNITTEGDVCTGPLDLIANVNGAIPSECTYQWSTNQTSQTISVNDSDTYSVTVTYGNCTETASTNITISDADATITPVGPFCVDDPAVNLTAANGGGVWSSTSSGLDGNTFTPGDAGVGSHTITYTISGTCGDEDEITIVVNDIINVSDLTEECDATNTNFTLSFNVTNSSGNPAQFNANWGSGSNNYTGTFSHDFPSGTVYSITVTDPNGCSEIELNGSLTCDCATYAGTMNLDPIHLCQTECTNASLHNGDENLDGNDIFEYVIHDGSYPANIYSYNSTSEFCRNSIPGGADYGTTYYISAIAGNSDGEHVMQSDPCYSQSVGTPVVWHQDPIAHINTNESSTCELTFDLSATPPPAGMIGYWSASGNFYAINGTTLSSPDISVMVTGNGDYTFTWTLVNNECTDSDEVIIHFNETPTAYAGPNMTVCGTTAELEAVYSVSGSSGQWSGSGATFSPTTSPNTTVSVGDLGTYVFTWTEYNGACFDNDVVSVTFLQEPEPSTIANYDTICGVTYNLNVTNVIGTGVWRAYDDGVQIYPAFINGTNENDPNAVVAIPNYSPALYRTIVFEWTETIQSAGIECQGTASIEVTFAAEPAASVGENQAQVCGHEITFDADTVGSGWANGIWLSPSNVIVEEWDDRTIPNATAIIDSLGSFGDSAYVSTQFYWAMSNHGCTSIDTMYVTFYQHPIANAGLDKEVCGLIDDLEAFWSIPPTENYEPTGWWTLHSAPDNASVNIHNINTPETPVNVSHPGDYYFIWRESNSNRPSCYSTDTVVITFIEIPLIDAGEDFDVCGPCTQLSCISAGFPGNWQPVAGSNFSPNQQDPNAEVCVNGFGPVTFIWQEANQQCVERDTVIVTFWRVPTAEIITDPADSTTCGYCFNRLQAGNPGTGIEGFWWSPNDANATFSEVTQTNPDTVCVTSYGYKDFYWIEETGPETAEPGFCTDTAGPLTIRFIQIPEADAGIDTLFCGYCGFLDANPSVGMGTWTTPSTINLTFDNPNEPDSRVCTSVLSDDNPNHDYYNIVWTEDNSNGCTDSDTIQAVFARIPKATIAVRPPKCFGEWASVIAIEDSLPQYQWVFEGAHIDSIAAENSIGGDYKHYVSWINTTDTAHFVSLVVTGSRGCTSSEVRDTVYEPQKPEYLLTIFPDTCALGKGGVRFSQDTIANSFEWLNPEEVGITSNHIYDSVQYNIPAGEYHAATVYTTFNLDFFSYYVNNFGTAYCYDTVEINIDYIGMIEASFEIAADVDLNSLVAPEAEVWFVNNSDYDEVRKRCEWHFGDDERLNSCDELVNHTYTQAGCFEPFLIVMNRDLPECRDTAYIDICIPVDDESNLEIPNIFTPNGDGINDYFQVKAKTLEEFKGVIVNRWGREVYTWENWQDMEAGWDGKLPGGSEATPGVYYYIIKAVGIDGLEYDEQGPLHLMREK
jgi:gliding motility-associated-like protein